jgi:transposase
MCIHPKATRKETTPAQRAAVWTRYCSGYSIPEIIALEGHPRSTVRSIIERREQSGDSTFQSKPRTGRPKKTTARDDRALLRAANRDTKATLFELATPSKSTHQLGRNTVRKILKAAGKAKRKPRTKPFLKPEHKYWRRKWCSEEKREGRDWNKVCWSDEVTFEVREDGSIFYVTRGPKEEFLDKNLKPSFKSGRTSIGVWSCYCRDEMGPLVIIEKGGWMTAKRYLATVKKYFVPFYQRMVRKYGLDVVM